MIMKVHLSAGKRIQKAYNMQYANGDCLVDIKNIILVGEKWKAEKEPIRAFAMLDSSYQIGNAHSWVCSKWKKKYL